MFSFLRDATDVDLFIDIGTSNTFVAAKNKGIIANEPSVIAYNEMSPGKKNIVGVGLEAIKLVSLSPGNITAARPLKNGIISDYKITEVMMKYYLSLPEVRKVSRHPNVILSIPYNATDVEKEALVDAAKQAGSKKVHLMENSLVAAIGAELNIQSAQGCMLVDIGGGSTEIAIISLSDIVYGKIVRTGGSKMDFTIKQYLKEKKSLIISEAAAEKIKVELGTACPKKDIRYGQVSGRDAETGLIRSIEISSDEIGDAMSHHIDEIINEIHHTLENTPPELVSDIIESGIVLTGGGALIRDIDFRIENEIRLPVHISQNPLAIVAMGGNIILKNKDLIEKLSIDTE